MYSELTTDEVLITTHPGPNERFELHRIRLRNTDMIGASNNYRQGHSETSASREYHYTQIIHAPEGTTSTFQKDASAIENMLPGPRRGMFEEGVVMGMEEPVDGPLRDIAAIRCIAPVVEGELPGERFDIEEYWELKFDGGVETG